MSENLGKIFIQRVMSRAAFKIFSPAVVVKDREAVRNILEISTTIWEDKYHNPCIDRSKS